MSELPGLDLTRLRAFLDRERPGLVAGELQGELIAGGRSNLTFDVTDGHQHWVVRRPPLGHVLATAHDMSREHRVISALAPTDVPVPGCIVLCEDTGVVGAPFYVMDKIRGYGVPGRGPARAARRTAHAGDLRADDGDPRRPAPDRPRVGRPG